MVWDVINIFLFVVNILMVLYILYNDVVILFWKGKMVLSVKLCFCGCWDGYIFVGIIVLLFVFNMFFCEGLFFIFVLFGIMGVLFIYICFFCSLKVVFKEFGFFYVLLFFFYVKIEWMNLFEDGVFVIEINC